MKSFITYKVVNADLFNSVDDVEFDLTSQGGTYKFGYRDAYFQGDVSLEINGEVRKTISGQHGANDYADDYGFQIVKLKMREEDKHWWDVVDKIEREHRARRNGCIN